MGLAGGMTEESPEIDAPKTDVPETPGGPAPAADAADDVPLLRIEGVSRTFGNFRAVDRLSLDVRAGEFFALLGPSGCGKTTLLRMLAGFETPDEGRILLGGRDIAPVLPHERPVNMMFQNYALFPHLSVQDNIAFGLKRAGMPHADIDTRVAEMVALRNLAEWRSESPISFPVARSSAWRWRARWRGGPRSCCSTSPWPRSTRSCVKARSRN